MKNKIFLLNIRSIFLMILFSGLLTLIAVLLIVFNRQKIENFESWKNNKIKESLTNTSSYYSRLTTKLVLQKNEEIQKLLNKVKKSEKLKLVQIRDFDSMSAKVLKTCSANPNQSFFNQVPTCYELKNNDLLIYHELRSFGYSLGYLVKEMKIEQQPILKNKKFLFNLFSLSIIFLFVNLITFFFLKKFIIAPLTHLSESLGNHRENQKFKISEIQRIYDSATNAIKENDLAKEAIKKMKIESKIEQIAKQLSHDIRSPLAALKAVKELGTSGLDPEVAKLLSISINRITDIANTILPKKNVPLEDSLIHPAQPTFLWIILDQIISQKRVEYQHDPSISIQMAFLDSPFSLHAFCEPDQLMRAISNIINNSVEAKISNQPLDIQLKVKKLDHHILLSIIDNGQGIAPSLVSKVFDESFSYGKTQGTGLGLFQVKKAIESWDASIDLVSDLSTGTQINIKLRPSPKPKWLVDSIGVSNHQRMIIVDDEEYVSTIIMDRFSKYIQDIRYFKTIADFESNLSWSSNALIWMDHDLKQEITGMDLIQKHQLQRHAILLTGNYDDKSIQNRAMELDILLLPKPLIHEIPILG